ncbi:MAG: hypothetical protein SFW67_13605 [Myxococcaceae bacterium]|nr:hypothetical protein [Myxococcaceae bacterium]
MMVRVVAILAAVALTGCGVGVEDFEGQAAVGGVGTSQDAIMGCVDPLLCPEVGGTPRPVTNPVAAGAGPVTLPQDPIPWRPPTSTPAERPFGPNGTPEPGVPRR